MDNQVKDFLQKYKQGLLNEEEVLLLLAGKSVCDLPEPQTLSNKELLEYVLNISSVLLGNKLPVQVDHFSKYKKEDLIRFLYTVKFPGRKALITQFLENLNQELDQDSSIQL